MYIHKSISIACENFMYVNRICIYMDDLITARHVCIYVRPHDRIKIMRKARRLGLSISELLVLGALEYNPQKEPPTDNIDKTEASQ